MEKIRIFSSQEEYYDHAFATFIKSTDQKENAKVWITEFLDGIDPKHTAIDAGAGNGVLTKILARHFDKVLAVEPNEALLAELATAGENVEVIDQPIAEGTLPGTVADLVLCSHVLYYIPQSQWDGILHQLLSWTKPGGRIVVILQAEDTDCMNFFRKLRNEEFPIMHFMEEFSRTGTAQSVDVFRQTSTIRCRSEEDLELILEFLLNLTPFPNEESIPTKADLRTFLSSLQRTESGEYSMSCDQLFYTITK
ncbi:class I SAM-dependent methyltransferase [Salmonirosea aquatica]|uniref:Methyltransferase domain-containing protein n=1 Tax=Salmonirosea aquatica TaxID=2654236 RepID=A0A7C9BD03_9BACT|nr:methyltransferase domain-containing protein [Cytophagaceae bacterium SJW1-29]